MVYTQYILTPPLGGGKFLMYSFLPPLAGGGEEGGLGASKICKLKKKDKQRVKPST